MKVPRAWFLGDESAAPAKPRQPRRWAEGLTVTAWVAGWLLVTAMLAALTTPWLWAGSLGLLLITFAGWAPLLVVARLGVHHLSRRQKEADDA